MKAKLDFVIETSSVQKAASLRDRAAEWLNEDPDVAVVVQQMAQLHDRWRVRGVDTQTRECFDQIVEAADPEAAKAQVETAKKVVNVVEEAA